VLLALVSCHKREEFSNAIRSTWLPQVPPGLDVKFFRGRGATRDPLPDEVFLDCGDAYLDLPEKVQAIVKWAHEKGYDYVAKCDDDVVVKPREWYAGFLRTDFSGWQDPGCKPGEIRTPWGFFYVMSRRVMELVIEAPLPGRPGAHHNYVHGNDEAWVSSVLHYQGIFLTSDPRYFLFLGEKPKPESSHGQWVEGHKRALRPRPPRFSPLPKSPVLDWFAACVYLNWTGWHNTGPEVILREFHKIFKEGL
jgi:hypothetical protein